MSVTYNLTKNSRLIITRAGTVLLVYLLAEISDRIHPEGPVTVDRLPAGMKLSERFRDLIWAQRNVIITNG